MYWRAAAARSRFRGRVAGHPRRHRRPAAVLARGRRRTICALRRRLLITRRGAIGIHAVRVDTIGIHLAAANDPAGLVLDADLGESLVGAIP